MQKDWERRRAYAVNEFDKEYKQKSATLDTKHKDAVEELGYWKEKAETNEAARRWLLAQCHRSLDLTPDDPLHPAFHFDVEAAHKVGSMAEYI